MFAWGNIDLRSLVFETCFTCGLIDNSSVTQNIYVQYHTYET